MSVSGASNPAHGHMVTALNPRQPAANTAAAHFTSPNINFDGLKFKIQKTDKYYDPLHHTKPAPSPADTGPTDKSGSDSRDIGDSPAPTADAASEQVPPAPGADIITPKATAYRPSPAQKQLSIPDDVLILHPCQVTVNADMLCNVVHEDRVLAVIPLHRQFIVDNVPYFQPYFREDAKWDESEQLCALKTAGKMVKFDLEFENADIVNEYFKAKYDGGVKLTQRNVVGLFSLSDFLADGDMADACRKYMMKHIGPDIFFAAWQRGGMFIPPCIEYLKHTGIINLFSKFQVQGAALAMESLVALVREVIAIIHTTERAYILDLIKYWVVKQRPDVDTTVKLLNSINCDEFSNVHKSTLFAALVESFDDTMTMSKLKRIKQCLFAPDNEDISVGSSTTLTSKEVHKRLFPFDDEDEAEYRIPRKVLRAADWEYTGGLKELKPHGKGVKKWANGTIHYGEWRDGKPEGPGIRKWPGRDGNFSGDWEQGQWTHGTYTWPDGGRYIGEFSNFKRHGQGIFKYGNGDRYTGHWCQDLKDGQGTYIYKNKTRYMGEWRANMKEGKGKMVYENGDSYNGEWKANRKSGYGVYQYASGSLYRGYWKEERKSGKGTFEYSHGDLYEGDFDNNLRTGKGHYMYLCGDVYLGEWNEDQKHGSGTYWYGDGNRRGDSYTGSWVNGAKHGQGLYIWADGSYYEGEWVHNERQGNIIIPPVGERPKVAPEKPTAPKRQTSIRHRMPQQQMGAALAGAAPGAGNAPPMPAAGAPAAMAVDGPPPINAEMVQAHMPAVMAAPAAALMVPNEPLIDQMLHDLDDDGDADLDDDTESDD